MELGGDVLKKRHYWQYTHELKIVEQNEQFNSTHLHQILTEKQNLEAAIFSTI